MTLNQITKVKGPGIHTLANIVSNTISLGGIATASNFKTGTSNLHNIGLEIAGINVLGADTPIGTGATIYDAGGAIFTGVVTATSFSGTSSLASGLTGTPDVAVRNITGVGATFTGNVSIGGTLTYEDVTNIDSVGIITARDGLKVLAGGANVVGVVTATSFVGGLPITSGADNRVITASSASAIQGEANLYFNGTSLSVGGSNVTDVNLLTLNGTGASTNIGIVFNKTNSPAKAHGIQVHNGTGDLLFYDYTASAERLRIDSAGNMGLGITPDTQGNTVDSLQIGSATNLYNETSDDYTILGNNVYFDGTNNKYIKTQQSSRLMQNAGEFTFQQAASGSADANITYTTPLKIAADSNITQTIDTDGDGFIITTGTADIKPMLTGISNRGAVNNTIFGISGKWSSNEVGRIAFEAGADTTNKDDGHINFYTRVSGGSLTSRFHINSSGNLRIGTAAAAGGRLYFESTSGAAQYIASGGTNNQDLLIASSAGTKLQIGADGHILPGASGTQDLGSASKEWGDVYLADNKRLKLGTDQDMLAYHDNTHGYVSNRKNNLYLEAPTYVMITSTDTNGSAQQTSARFLRGGAVELYHNDKLRLSTWSDAVNVYGDQDTDARLHLYADEGDNADDKWKLEATASGSNFSIQNYVNGSWETSLKATGNSHTELYHGDDIRFRTNGDGAEFFDSDNNCNVYFTCNGTRRGYLFVDATNGGKIGFMDPQNHWLISGTKNSSVDLYHDNTLRLQTSSTGATVTGEVAASQDYPNYQPTLDLNFAASKKLDSRIAYTRTGPASYVDEFGKVVLVGENTPRFDHDPTTRECKGLLIEESRTNMIIYSTDYTQSSLYEFSSYEGAISENLGTAPDGSQTDAFIGEGNTGRHTLYIKVGTSLSNSTKYSMSIFVKRVSNHSNERYCRLETASYSTWTHAGGSGTFDLSNGTQITSPSSNITSGIETYSDGWYRIFMTTTTGTVASNTGFYLNITNSSGSSASTTLTGSQGLFVYGTQMEAGDFITSYIPTIGRTVSRGSDDLVIDGGEFTDFINKPEGTILADYKVIGGNPEIMYLSNDNSNCRIGLYEAGSSQTRFLVNNAGTLADTTDSAGTTVGDNIKSAGAYKLNDVAAAKNGVISSTDSSVTIPDGIDRAYIGGYYNGDVEGSLGLRRLVYYQQRLPNSQLVTLTA